MASGGRGPRGGGASGRRGCIAAAAGVLAGGRLARSGAASRLRDGPSAMAASLGPAGVGGAGPSGFAFDSGLEIKTRSVEQTLLPLVSQVKWHPEPPLVSLRPRPRWRRPLARPRGRVGPGGRQPLPHIPHRDCGVGSGGPSEAWGPASAAAAALVRTIRNPAGRPPGLRGGESPADPRARQAGAPPGLPHGTRSASPAPPPGPAKPSPIPGSPEAPLRLHPQCTPRLPAAPAGAFLPASKSGVRSPRPLSPSLRVSARWAPGHPGPPCLPLPLNLPARFRRPLSGLVGVR